MRGLLLVEGRHAKLLVHKCLVLSATGSVAIMCIVAEGWLVQVSKLGHNRVDTPHEALILLDHIQLVCAAAKARDSFAEVLRQYLEGAVCLLSTDEDLTHYINQSSSSLKLFRESCNLPLVLPFIISNLTEFK